MTKITEASSLSSLGLSKDQIRGIYNQSGLALRHNMGFEEVKTKAQALSRLKREHFIVAVRDGEAMLLYKRRGGYQIASPDDKSYHNSLKDALAEVPGKGWTYYSSKADNSDYTPLQKDPERDREESHEDVVRPLMKQLNRVYGDEARKIGAQAAEDIRNEAVKYFDAADDDYTGYIGKDYADQLRRSYKAFKTLAASERPFDEITGYTFNSFGAKEFSKYVDDQLKLTSKRYDWSSASKIERFIKNAKLPLAKIARYGLNLIKKERDYVLRNAPDYQQTAGPAKLDKIKKAWESFKRSGDIKPLS